MRPTMERKITMNKIPAHITIEGVPLCQCEAHMAGLMNTLEVTCGHESLAAAHRAKREIQRHRHSVKVVPGACPAGPVPEDPAEAARRAERMRRLRDPWRLQEVAELVKDLQFLQADHPHAFELCMDSQAMQCVIDSLTDQAIRIRTEAEGDAG